MAVTRVESLRAYRDVLRRRTDQALHVALEAVPGGEWDGMEVVRKMAVSEAIESVFADEPDAVATVAEVSTPGRVFVSAICPRCAIPTRLLVEVHTELVVSDEGAEIRAKSKSKPSAHTCGQLPLEDAEETDEEQMALSDLVGPTEPTLVLNPSASRPDDATLALADDEKCNAETEIPDDTEAEGVITLVCERPMDHEDGDHWAEGGFAWHFEDRPIPLGITNLPTEEEEAEGE